MQPFEIDWLSMKPDESHRLAGDYKIVMYGALSILFSFVLVGINGEFEDLNYWMMVVGTLLLLLGAPISLQSRYVMWFKPENTFVVYVKNIFGISFKGLRIPSNLIQLVYEVQKGDTVKINHEVREISRERTDSNGLTSTSISHHDSYSMLIERKDGTIVVSPQGDILTSRRKINMMRMKEIFSSKQIK